jgi:hypothetical protein
MHETVARYFYDFTDRSVYGWTPIEEGPYTIVALARNVYDGQISARILPFYVRSRVDSEPLVTGTAHPLVALYSAPPCAPGNRLRVNFFQVGLARQQSTPALDCNGVYSMNVYLAGMPPQTQHLVYHEELDRSGNTVAVSPVLTHATGPLPEQLLEEGLPGSAVATPADLDTSIVDDVVLASPISNTGDLTIPTATNLRGRTLWYYFNPLTPNAQIWRPVSGGTFLVNFAIDGVEQQGLREIDLAGNALRETTASRIAEQLRLAPGEVVSAIHHEAIRLPNGYTALLVSSERMLEDVQGAVGEVAVIGDWVVVLDRQWQVRWSWSAFDHLDIERAASLGEVCGNQPPNNAGCPPVLLVDGISTFANDWTHANAITYSPADGNLLVSMRHQDWVIKLDYRNGRGSGDVLWRLGPDGDFTIASEEVFPWFSHQHDASYISDDRILVYDNGNLRCEGPAGDCSSRGQVYEVNEGELSAHLVVNADLGHYAFAVGNAQRLSNGNLHFHSGILRTADDRFYSEVVEIESDGRSNFRQYINQPSYRSFRLTDLYSAVRAPTVP